MNYPDILFLPAYDHLFLFHTILCRTSYMYHQTLQCPHHLDNTVPFCMFLYPLPVSTLYPLLVFPLFFLFHIPARLAPSQAYLFRSPEAVLHYQSGYNLYHQSFLLPDRNSFFPHNPMDIRLKYSELSPLYRPCWREAPVFLL